MICDRIIARMDALVDGALTGPERDEILGHVEACVECHDLLTALAATRAAPEDPGLADAIVARTSGSTCVSARERLVARVDGELDALDVELVDGHLRKCTECAALVRALEWAAQALPRFAEIDPGPAFLARVLARTSRDPRRTPLGSRITAILARLLDRPRVAWEGAFVATVILCAPVLAPSSPLADVPREALSHLRGTLNGLEARVIIGARDVWATGAVAVEDSTALASSLARQVRKSLGTFPAPDASGQTRDGAEASASRSDTAQEDRR